MKRFFAKLAKIIDALSADQKIGECACGGNLWRKYSYLDFTYCDKCGKSDAEM